MGCPSCRNQLVDEGRSGERETGERTVSVRALLSQSWSEPDVHLKTSSCPGRRTAAVYTELSHWNHKRQSALCNKRHYPR